MMMMKIKNGISLYIQPLTEIGLPVVPGLTVVPVPNVVAAVVPILIVGEKVLTETTEATKKSMKVKHFTKLDPCS
jgi:hypothetical protein